MFSDVYEYIGALWPQWLTVATFSVPYVVNEALKSSSRYRAFADKLASPDTRRMILFLILLGSVFSAGFLAWREERDKRLLLENKMQVNTLEDRALGSGASRIQVSLSPSQRSGFARVTFANYGAIPAQIRAKTARILVVENGFAVSNEDESFLIQNRQLIQNDAIISNVIEIQPNQAVSTEYPLRGYQLFPASEEQLSSFAQGKSFLVVHVSTLFGDTASSKDIRKLNQYCVWVRSASYDNLEPCPNLNKTTIVLNR